MNYAKSMLACCCIGLLLSLAGCAKKSSYKPHQLLSLKDSAHIDYQETKEQVTVRTKAFTKIDSDYIFGERADRIIGVKDPLQSIQLCIENNGPSAVKLVESSIDLPLVSSKEVTQRLESRSKYIAGGIVGGIGLCGILVGVIAIATTTVTCPCCVLVPLVFHCGIGSLLVIASPFAYMIENSGTRAENSRINNYIQETNIGKEIVINPGKTIDMLIFVRKAQFKTTFDLTLLNEQDQTKKQTFEVKLDRSKITE